MIERTAVLSRPNHGELMRILLIGATIVLSTCAIFSQSTLDAPNKVSQPLLTYANGQNKTSVSSFPKQGWYTPPTAKVRQKRFVNSVFGPLALGKNVAWAGIGTWRNSPEEWGDKWEGFGRRVASNFGKNVIKQSTIYGLDAAFKIDSHYYRSQKKDVGSRVLNALISPVTARNRDGKRVFGISRIAGTYTSSIIAAETWYPDRFNYKDGLKSGTLSLGLNGVYNLVKEFVWKK